MGTMLPDPAGTSRYKIKNQVKAGESELDLSSIKHKVGKASKAGEGTMLDKKDRVTEKGSGMSDAGKAQLAAQGVDAAAQMMGDDGTDSTTGTVTGAASGAATGFAFGGPKGAAIGGVIGGIAGGLSAESKRRAANRQARAQMLSARGQIAQQKGKMDANILGGLASNLSRTLV